MASTSSSSGVAETAGLGALVGVATGGVREWQASGGVVNEKAIAREEMKIRDKYKGRNFETLAAKQQLRYMAKKELMGLRLFRACMGSARWGLALGSVAAACSSIEIAAQRKRGQDDLWNAVIAGAGSGSVLGICLPGGIGVRLRGAAIGLAAGGLISLPFGYLRGVVKDAHVPVSLSDGDGDGGDTETDAVDRRVRVQDPLGNAIRSFEKASSQTK